MSDTFLFDGVERPLTPEMVAQRQADAEAAQQPQPAPPPAVETMTIEELQQLLLAAQARLAQLAAG
ncbi:hypothetical protein [Pseudoroseomonas cervicalis]|uniref:hypothetical protein n=1 Tax=Teichococcus cervicalis TaxID=204525 RepID=UPI002789FE71|nr:hypothetical protein [Pseudoroseomonas cervicalis]MDQ1078014.1 hypothetical protein [Pseudoroseomonas cervicalis]